MMSLMIPVMLSGGSGSRLWPLSRSDYPKQLLSLHGQHSLLQQTALRVADRAMFAAPLVICHESQRFMVASQLQECGVQPAAMLLEPMGRNTAPAIAIAALKAVQTNPHAMLLILPADHCLNDKQAFNIALENAVQTAHEGYLVTFGIEPQRAETGYGYIEKGAALKGGSSAFSMAGFVEKPDAATAQTYINSGKYLWNSGMFVFPAALLLEEMERFCPALLGHCRAALAGAKTDLDFIRLDAQAFAQCDNLPIDVAVMERTNKGAVLPARFGWSDIGSYESLWEMSPKDAAGNVLHGDVLCVDASGNYVHSHQLTGLVGVENLVVASTPDALLVAHRSKAQEVKQLVEKLQAEARPELACQQKVYRPWGYYRLLHASEQMQVKELHIHPQAKLSLQKHFRRAEHWVVIAGRAKVERDGEIIELSAQESVYVPRGAIHRLANASDESLVVIEVQTGDYLGEDDILRLDDDFGRASA